MDLPWEPLCPTLASMVNLTRIYTRTGDDGTTSLGDMSRTRKTDARLAAYADVDEANSSIGVALAVGGIDGDVHALLTGVQNDLFDVGADLCTPVVPDPEHPPLRITEDYIDRLEGACDSYNENLEPLRSFILPGVPRPRLCSTWPAPSPGVPSGRPGRPSSPTATGSTP